MFLNVLGQIQDMKEETEAIKGDTKHVKEVATDIKKDTKDIKEDTESLKKDIESIKKGQGILIETQQKFEKELTQIKERVTKKPVEKTERNSLSHPGEPNFSELYLFDFSFVLNELN